MKIKSMLLMLTGLFLLVSIYSFKPAQIFACSCAEPPSVEDSLQRKTAIFTGTVINLEQPQPDEDGNISSAALVKATLEVNEVWKGELGEEVFVYTAQKSESCGYEEFALDQEFIVFAYGEPNQLETGICEGTKRVSSADVELAALGEGYAPMNGIQSTEPIKMNLNTDKTNENNKTLQWVLLIPILFIVICLAILFYFLIKRRSKRQ